MKALRCLRSSQFFNCCRLSLRRESIQSSQSQISQLNASLMNQIPFRIKEKLADGQTRFYNRGKLLGSGSFGCCYQVTLGPGKQFALKAISKLFVKKVDDLQKQVQIQRSLNHQNVVKLVNFFEDDMCYYIILELCSNQTLNEMLKWRKHLTEIQAQYYLWQVLQGLKHLHANKVVHRDVKLANLFISDKLVLKIGDFGLAASLKERVRRFSICGTPNFMAPQIVSRSQQGHSFEVDIWSFGVLVFTLLEGYPPFQEKDLQETNERIMSCNYKFSKERGLSAEAKDLIKSLLVFKPQERMTLQQIQKHIFFNKNQIPGTLPLATLISPPSNSFIKQYPIRACLPQFQLDIDIPLQNTPGESWQPEAFKSQEESKEESHIFNLDDCFQQIQKLTTQTSKIMQEQAENKSIQKQKQEKPCDQDQLTQQNLHSSEESRLIEAVSKDQSCQSKDVCRYEHIQEQICLSSDNQISEEDNRKFSLLVAQVSPKETSQMTEQLQVNFQAECLPAEILIVKEDVNNQSNSYDNFNQPYPIELLVQTDEIPPNLSQLHHQELSMAQPQGLNQDQPQLITQLPPILPIQILQNIQANDILQPSPQPQIVMFPVLRPHNVILSKQESTPPFPIVLKIVGNQKFGIVYILSNGDVGACFNDKTKLIYNCRDCAYNYFDSSDNLVSQVASDQKIPQLLVKKMKVLKYMLVKLQFNGVFWKKFSNIQFFVRKWHMNSADSTIIFKFNNKSFQASFLDSSQVAVDNQTGSVWFKPNKRKQWENFDRSSELPGDIKKRLRHVNRLVQKPKVGKDIQNELQAYSK